MNRVYRPAFSHEKAMQMLMAESGKAFDPAIVDCFMRNAMAIAALRERITVRRMTFADLVQDMQ
jgi:putative two-component system response regulator